MFTFRAKITNRTSNLQFFFITASLLTNNDITVKQCNKHEIHVGHRISLNREDRTHDTLGESIFKQRGEIYSPGRNAL